MPLSWNEIKTRAATVREEAQAAETMGKLHNRLREVGYRGHPLELYLVRLMFCLFADDTGIFEPSNIFNKYIMERTGEDGSDLALHLQKIFEVLNKPKEKRLKTIDEQLDQFPYINGRLFEETIEIADFDRPMRDTLIECFTLDWSKISPAIFGAMFQSVMNDAERHDIGAHYTSEENILKLIHPLFLDNLRNEFNKIKKLSPSLRKERLTAFHQKIANLKFLDPACGCGNFLVVSYRELRLLELDILKLLLDKEQGLDIYNEIKVNVNQFYGIEIEEFPAQIAQAAMWLVDHQMNMLVRERFGEYYIRIPLTVAASIHCTNALTTDWESVVPKNELSYILGNPPFLGSKIMNKLQRKEVHHIFSGVKNCGILDYVTCWYKKAAQYIQDTQIEAAFVSTNSITQGEQVPVLWQELMNKHHVKINFAHQTFKWSNEARGKAAVYCVIVGFSLADWDNEPPRSRATRYQIFREKNLSLERKLSILRRYIYPLFGMLPFRNAAELRGIKPALSNKKIYHYTTVTSKPIETTVKQINAYLIDFANIFITSRSKPLCTIPPMCFGNMPLDGGHLLLSDDEKKALLEVEPTVKKYIKPFISAREFLNGLHRWCIWLVGVEPSELRKMPEIMKRIEAVKQFRMASIAPSTREHAIAPALFRDRNQPDCFIVIPRVSSENRKYIPMVFFDHNSIAGDTCMVIPDAKTYHFGILTSTMHMAWTRYVCGRLKSDYRYSKDIVYNNFPWPADPSERTRKNIEEAAQKILDIRETFPNSSLADLYDPLTMPPKLIKAHHKLDKLIDKAYGRDFDNDSQRVAYLFELYQKINGELFVEDKKRGKGRKV